MVFITSYRPLPPGASRASPRDAEGDGFEQASADHTEARNKFIETAVTVAMAAGHSSRPPRPIGRGSRRCTRRSGKLLESDS
jgi:hypothetical protein